MSAHSSSEDQKVRELSSDETRKIDGGVTEDGGCVPVPFGELIDKLSGVKPPL